ncbi:hypothetical protein HDF11_002332 [Tunturiibacter psychrotolerans]
MEEYEADDALASAAFLAREDSRVERVVISTPDKILLSAFRERGLFNLTAADVLNGMNRESYRSLESNRTPFPTTSP